VLPGTVAWTLEILVAVNVVGGAALIAIGIHARRNGLARKQCQSGALDRLSWRKPTTLAASRIPAWLGDLTAMVTNAPPRMTKVFVFDQTWNGSLGEDLGSNAWIGAESSSKYRRSI